MALLEGGAFLVGIFHATAILLAVLRDEGEGIDTQVGGSKVIWRERDVGTMMIGASPVGVRGGGRRVIRLLETAHSPEHLYSGCKLFAGHETDVLLLEQVFDIGHIEL